MKPRILKLTVWLVLLILIYEIGGALIPFMHTEETGETFKENFQPDSFYSDNISVDRARIVEDSQDALDCRISMIHQAKELIRLSTFDIREGQSCRDIFSSLLEAADRGIKIQILVDGLYGSVHMSGNPIFYVLGSHPNVEIRFYNIPNLLKPWTINGRLHDKYLIIDDQLLLLGGRNTFDYFLGEYNLDNLSYDRDVLIYNTAYETPSEDSSVIFPTNSYFEELWASQDCKTVFNTPSKSMKEKLDGAENELENHYAALIGSTPSLAAPGKNYEPETVAINKATLISNPTHIFAKEPWVWYQVQYLMEHAKKQVYIQTPYAVFSQDMYQGMAAIAAHVPSVQMMLNATSVGDNFMASSDYTLNRDKILKTGVTLLEYFGKQSSHGKSILIDDRLSIIGSYNLDMRSTYVDTETMLVIDGQELNEQLKKHITNLESDALKVADDGTYEQNPDIPIVELSHKKKILFAITSRLFQLIRYLI